MSRGHVAGVSNSLLKVVSVKANAGILCKFREISGTVCRLCVWYPTDYILIKYYVIYPRIDPARARQQHPSGMMPIYVGASPYRFIRTTPTGACPI